MRQLYQWLTSHTIDPGVESTNLSIAERAINLKCKLLAAMLLITLIPLVVTAILSYFQYRNLLQQETFNNARQSTENAKQAIEAYLSELQAAILVVADAYDPHDLADQRIMGQVFAKLKARHDGLVDLSFIGPDGVQKSYAGPYDLAGKDYTSSPWHHEALARRVYVSEVFLGYRNAPHFVVAVSKKNLEGAGYWILRASIDTKTLDYFIASISGEAIDDMFLMTEQGTLQSSSRFYDQMSAKITLITKPRKSGVTVMYDQRDGQTLIRAAGYIKGTPWILVQDRPGYFKRSNWISFRNQLLLTFAVCLILAWIAGYRIADSVCTSVQKSDESREIMLHETEHTSKLASIGRLAAGVAHEINNPLAIINEKAGLMKDLLMRSDNFNYKEKFLNQLVSLESAVSRARIITHRLLGFARRMEVSLENINIPDVMEEVLGFLEKEAAYRNILIEKNFEPGLPEIKSDHGQLQQIFLNIINNAIDAVDHGGKITIDCRRNDQDSIAVDISDNGPGMPPEIVKNIFVPFFTTKKGKEKQGTGLGLSITYGLVKKLGGEISVHSEVGIGTTFSFIFPTNQKEPQVTEYEY